MKHCCEQMDYFLQEKKVCIGFDQTVREYFIDLNGSPCKQGIFYCPWCGKKLPSSLGKKRNEILEKEFGLDIDEIEDEKGIPKEFETDEWWKKTRLIIFFC